MVSKEQSSFLTKLESYIGEDNFKNDQKSSSSSRLNNNIVMNISNDLMESRNNLDVGVSKNMLDLYLW